MLSRYLEICTVVKKTLKDLDHGLKCLDENKLSLTNDLKKALAMLLHYLLQSCYCFIE